MTGRPFRDESEGQRLDRQLGELLQELRVVLPGVQVLFAFLLTVPFSARFGEPTEVQRSVYVGVLLGTALATVLLMAPTAFHRLRFRQHRKAEVVEMSHRLVLAGLAVLAAAVSAAVFLVVDVVYGRAGGLAAGLSTLAVIIVLWWIVPLAGRGAPAAPPPER
jgi:predicted neutral ceramidase superfamily lipid hydrolase